MERKSQFSLACSLLSRMVKEKQGSLGTRAIDDRTEEAMTIFYGGNVFVFDGVAEERAEHLMQMATTVGTAVTAAAAAEGVPARVLVQTRRASLHRFLNRRKERINGRAPYRIGGGGGDVWRKMGAMAESESRSWLSLGREMTAREVGERS